MGKCPLFTFLKERSTHPRMIGRGNTLCERHRFFPGTMSFSFSDLSSAGYIS
ncbi:hypothetical protein BACIH_0413 [Bacillus amyloliquefaciens]|nr:hypothetical protein U471_04390 [Bacillus amyloliquefaciens CC178]QEY89219.1 hypothetical protein BACIT_1290 [Bacillus amyloliquefaciens]QEY92203.1 hypothetical protein BACIH_0413 [Bacillus amyloliquefaciens]